MFKFKPKVQHLTLFQKISLQFYSRPRMSAVFFLVIVAFGVASYTTLLRREGFPTISIPYSFVTGPYIVNNASKVDQEVSKPISEMLVKQDNVKKVESQSAANYFNIIIQYKDGTDAKMASDTLEEKVQAAGILPKEAKPEYKPLSPGFNYRGDDILVAFYNLKNNQSAEQLANKAKAAANYIQQSNLVPMAQNISIVDPFVRGTNPRTGREVISQTSFDRFVTHSDSNIKSYRSILIGIKGVKGFDVLELDNQLQQALSKLNNDPQYSGFRAVVSYSPAPQINEQISNLQQSLLEGLTAVLVVSAILIAFRASFITVASMAVVLTATLGVIYLIGYTLNTITLFSLVLCLSLIVDDTIIMVEAIDAQRRRSKKASEVVEVATKKISRAMMAATFTAAMGFAPLIFVGGILGSFVRAIPITVITSLLVSLLVALTLIPFLSRYLLLRPKQLGEDQKHESAAHHLEGLIAQTIARPIIWAAGHPKRQFGLGISAAIIGLGFILAGGFLFQKVTFNIFPSTKDSDRLLVQMSFAPNSSIDRVQQTASNAEKIVDQQLGSNLVKASYYSSGETRTASLYIDLVSFKKRDIKSPELIKKLDAAFVNFKGAQLKVSQMDAGPPAGDFTVRIETNKRDDAYRLAQDIHDYLDGRSLKRTDGSKANIKSVIISNPDTITRRDAKQYISVSAEFDGTDTSTLVLLAQKAVEDEFTGKRLAKYDLKPSNLVFDFGTEGENQDSFKTLLIAFPILLAAIYLLLLTQFRSWLQPLLIFMAIPFSLFGITTGLWLTNNAFSFFTMLGFFALIGLSIKNTILLTDYANQARRAGAGPSEAITIALQERFRPLIATSLTAIFSLIPLYLSNPFWEGLAVTLMFGLLSSTFLVITVFPYYYLGAEFLRRHIRLRAFGQWLILSIILSFLVAIAKKPALIALAPITAFVVIFVWRKKKRPQKH